MSSIRIIRKYKSTIKEKISLSIWGSISSQDSLQKNSNKYLLDNDPINNKVETLIWIFRGQVSEMGSSTMDKVGRHQVDHHQVDHLQVDRHQVDQHPLEKHLQDRLEWLMDLV